ETRLHLGPLLVEHPVVDGVAPRAVVVPLVLPEHALLDSADAQHGVARAAIQDVGLELDAHAAQRLERVAEHQVLGLGADVRALIRATDPGPSDPDRAVVAVDVPETRRAGDVTARLVHGRERERTPLRLLVQRGLDVGPQLLARAHAVGGPAPEIRI